MTIFADASALTAILAEDPGWEAVFQRLGEDPVRLISAITMWETMAALCRSHRYTPAAAQADVSSFASHMDLTFVTIGAREAALAASAYATFGRGRHPAALSMADCFAYACAKANKAALLFINAGFGETDIRCAL